MSRFNLHNFSAGAVLASFAVALLCSQAMAASAPDNRTHQFALNAGDLDQSLRQLSEQTGVAIVYDHRLIEGRQGRALYGSLTARDALSALLDGSPLEYREIDGRTLAILESLPVVGLPPENIIAPPDLISGDPRIDEIIVTASYRAPSYHSSVRIDYSLDSEVLELSGAQNVTEPIHELPAAVASVSSANTQLQISAGGLNMADLRGLDPLRTLVLVDGRRFVRTNGGLGTIHGVDLNNIPTGFIDRIEVINQGGGPVFGTDAVAGAINIVTRDHIDGFSLSADGGLSEHGDAGEYSFSAFAGRSFADERGSVSLGASYASDASLFFTDRDYLSEPYGFGLDGRRSTPELGEFLPGFGRSVFTPAGTISGAVGVDDQVALFGGFPRISLTDGGFEPYESRIDQNFNWVQGYSALPEIDRLHGLAKADYEVSSSLSFYGQFLFAKTETASQVAPAPISAMRGESLLYGDAIVVDADHPDAPAGLRAAVEAEFGGPVQSFLINRRFVELGPRRRDIDRQTLQFSAGFQATLGDGWTMDGVYQFGRNRVDDASTGVASARRVAIAVDPALCAATPGCAPLDIFSGENVSAASADFYRLDPRKRRLVTEEQVLRLFASKTLYELGDREARLNIGGEFRRDRLKDGTPPGYNDELALAEFEIPGVDAAVEYGEFFGGADFPLFSEAAALGAIDVGADVRLTRWSGGGFISNIAGDVSWRPVNGLELYAYALHGGRAPTAPELFLPGPNFSLAVFDPCGFPFDEKVEANCNSAGPLGTPAGFTQATPLARITNYGNPELDAEKVHSRHFGIAADVQDFFNMGDDALRITADWRFVRIRNAINYTNREAPLAACYDSENLSSPFCGTNPATGNLYIQREPGTGALINIESTYLNGGNIRSSGLDTTLAYRSDLIWAPFSPSLSVDVLYSYTHRIDKQDLFASGYESELGLPQFPRHQVHVTAGLETDRFKTQWTIRRRGEAITNAFFEDVPEARLPATTYVDVGFQFRPSNALILYTGVENLFDVDLPVAAFAESGFHADFYDPIGRRYFAGLKAEF